MTRPEANIGGYFITEVIRERLQDKPDLKVEDSVGRVYSIVFGVGRGKGEPAHSAFCRIEEVGRTPRERAAGGMTRLDALTGIGIEIRDLVRPILEQEEGKKKKSLDRGVS